MNKNVLEENKNENDMINVKKKHLVELYTDINEKKNHQNDQKITGITGDVDYDIMN